MLHRQLFSRAGKYWRVCDLRLPSFSRFYTHTYYNKEINSKDNYNSCFRVLEVHSLTLSHSASSAQPHLSARASAVWPTLALRIKERGKHKIVNKCMLSATDSQNFNTILAGSYNQPYCFSQPMFQSISLQGPSLAQCQRIMKDQCSDPQLFSIRFQEPMIKVN